MLVFMNSANNDLFLLDLCIIYNFSHDNVLHRLTYCYCSRRIVILLVFCDNIIHNTPTLQIKL